MEGQIKQKWGFNFVFFQLLYLFVLKVLKTVHPPTDTRQIVWKDMARLAVKEKKSDLQVKVIIYGAESIHLFINQQQKADKKHTRQVFTHR